MLSGPLCLNVPTAHGATLSSDLHFGKDGLSPITHKIRQGQCVEVSESDLAVTKDALNQPTAAAPAATGPVWPDKLFPLSGCRLLQHHVTDTVYEMEIRPLAKSISDQVPDQNSAKSWYDFLDKNNLSPSDRIACLQRAVLLEPRYPGWWYSLGCAYELEGKDWYGATNAFNHVIFLHPKSGNAWFSLSQLWASRGVMSKAQECRARFDELSKNPSS